MPHHQRFLSDDWTLFPIECAANPLRFVCIVEQDGIEAARPVLIRTPSSDEPPFRGKDDTPLLSSRNALRRTTETRIRAQAHFDKNQGITFQANQVEFPTLATYVAGEGFESMSSQPRNGTFFSQLPARLR